MKSMSTTTIGLAMATALPTATQAFHVHNFAFVARSMSSLPSPLSLPAAATGPDTLIQTRAATYLRLSLPFFEEEDACDPYEDEDCEFNWDFPTTSSSSSSSSHPSAASIASEVEEILDDEKDVDMQPSPAKSLAAIGATPTNSVTDKRVHLEMSWQIEECETEEDSCEDFCQDCAGSGKVRCRFCHGTRTLALNNEFAPCPICTDGTVDCDPCRGTGFIAPWATTMEDHLADKRP